jgi:selenophosphate synthetase-related protein
MQDAWSFGDVVLGPGDDAAVLQNPSAKHLLLAADPILPLLVEKDPYQAGRAAALVNANDIFAMGGTPLAMVNVMVGVNEEQEEAICRGLREESLRLKVPLVGGHISPEGGTPFLAVAMVGEAKVLLADHLARSGQEIVLAMDLRGERWGDYILNWDSHAAKDAGTLCNDLGVLCKLAEQGMCVAAKDVSNAGILGSLAMLLENAGLGAAVDLEQVSVPEPFTLADWLKIYPSYGFLLICSRDAKSSVLERFEARGIWAQRIGETDSSNKLLLRRRGERAVLFDFNKQGILKPHG